MMDDYIKREAVFQIISDAPRCYLNDVIRADTIRQAVKKLPAADVVEVVRCKDCKHFFDDGTDNVAIYKCELLHEKMRDDFFCADGERRTENE